MVKIKNTDLLIESPPNKIGGQHVGIDPTVKITHISTGIVIECNSERSRWKNYKMAVEILRHRLCSPENEKANNNEGGVT